MQKPRPDSLAVAALLTTLVAFGPISTDLYLPSLPSLRAVFDTDVARVQLTLSVFLAAFAVGQLIYGPLSDRFGRRPVLLGGVTVYFLAGLACASAPSIEALIAGRFVQAVGACSGVVLARAVVRDVYGRERAAKVFAYMGAAMALAPLVGPVIGGYLQIWFGWRASFLCLAAFGAASLAAVWLMLAETNPRPDPQALSPRRMVGNFRRMLGDRAYVGYVLSAAFSYSGLFAFISGSAFVLMDLLGLSPDRYGLCFATVVAGYICGSTGAGRLTLGLGTDRLIAVGVAVNAIGGGLMAALAWSGAVAPGLPGVAAIVGPMFVYMIGMGITLPNAMAGAIGPFPEMAGAASALLGFIQMGAASLLGVAVGHLHDGTALPMATAIALMGCAALVIYFSVLRPARARGAG
jgi:DHA1 family bicyclomycin/chloramphenicol resistance-like MFS transporter